MKGTTLIRSFAAEKLSVKKSILIHIAYCRALHALSEFKYCIDFCNQILIQLERESIFRSKDTSSVSLSLEEEDGVCIKSAEWVVVHILSDCFYKLRMWPQALQKLKSIPSEFQSLESMMNMSRCMLLIESEGPVSAAKVLQQILLRFPFCLEAAHLLHSISISSNNPNSLHQFVSHLSNVAAEGIEISKQNQNFSSSESLKSTQIDDALYNLASKSIPNTSFKSKDDQKAKFSFSLISNPEKLIFKPQNHLNHTSSSQYNNQNDFSDPIVALEALDWLKATISNWQQSFSGSYTESPNHQSITNPSETRHSFVPWTNLLTQVTMKQQQNNIKSESILSEETRQTHHTTHQSQKNNEVSDIDIDDYRLGSQVNQKLQFDSNRNEPIAGKSTQSNLIESSQNRIPISSKKQEGILKFTEDDEMKKESLTLFVLDSMFDVSMIKSRLYEYLIECQYEELISMWNRLSRLESVGVFGFEFVAFSFNRIGKFAALNQLVNRMLSTSPYCWQTWLCVGIRDWSRRKPSEAIQNVNRAIYQNPTSSFCYVIQTHIHMQHFLDSYAAYCSSSGGILSDQMKKDLRDLSSPALESSRRAWLLSRDPFTSNLRFNTIRAAMPFMNEAEINKAIAEIETKTEWFIKLKQANFTNQKSNQNNPNNMTKDSENRLYRDPAFSIISSRLLSSKASLMLEKKQWVEFAIDLAKKSLQYDEKNAEAKVVLQRALRAKSASAILPTDISKAISSLESSLQDSTGIENAIAILTEIIELQRLSNQLEDAQRTAQTLQKLSPLRDETFFIIELLRNDIEALEDQEEDEQDEQDGTA